MRIVFDIETAPLREAAEYLEPVEAPANYKDPVKIDAFKAEKQAENLERAGLDVDLCTIVAIGWYREGEASVQALTRQDCDEDGLIQEFWKVCQGPSYIPYDPSKAIPTTRSDGAHLVGFNCLAFDLPVLVRRSQYLGIAAPPYQIDKYRHAQVTDLMQILSFNGMVRARSLAFYAKRFGVVVPDDLTGAEVAQAVADGRWDAIRAHVTADVQRTARLAEKLGLLKMSAVAL